MRGGTPCGARFVRSLKLDLDVGFVFEIGHPDLVLILGLLLKHEGLNFGLHLFKRPKLTRLFVVDPHDVQPFRRLHNARDLPHVHGCQRLFQRGNQLALSNQAEPPAARGIRAVGKAQGEILERFTLLEGCQERFGSSMGGGEAVRRARLDQDLAELVFLGIDKPILILLVVPFHFRVRYHNQAADFAVDNSH